MFISLAGETGTYNNRLFQPLEIKPNSFVCLHNFSCKKNEILTFDEPVEMSFFQDYANIFTYEIPAGTYSVYTLKDEFNSTIQANPMERFNLSAFLTEESNQQIRFNVRYTNQPMPSLDFGITPEDDSGKPFDTVYNVTTGPNNEIDASGRATFKDIGAVSTESYTAIPSQQTTIPKMEDGAQTLGICSFLSPSAPMYVPIDLSGTSASGFDSQTQATNLVQTAIVQATGQKYPDEDLPLQIENNNSAENASHYKQADIMRTTGFTSWVNGAIGTKDFIFCVGEETLDSSGNTNTNLITDITDFADSDKNTDKRIWMRYMDPRNNGNKLGLEIGWWKYVAATDTKTWTTASARLTTKNEERLAMEGNKYTMLFEPNNDGKAPDSLYHPRIYADTLTYKSPSITKDVFTHNICFWDMDVEYSATDTFFYNATHAQTAGRFKDSNYLHSKYKQLWNNVGYYNEGECNSGHIWGTTIGRDESFDDNYDMGIGFELRTGSGGIDFTQSDGINKTPGYYNSAFGVSRSFNSGADGYQNAFYKFPDMWGSSLFRTHKGVTAGSPEGTILPATMSARTRGSYYMSICFRLDDVAESKYQIIFAYEGSDPATGVVTDPHTMLAVKEGASTLLVSDGGPTAGDRDEVNVTKQSDGTPYTFSNSKWYNIAIVFQKNAGPSPTAWEIVGIDEDGVKFIANPTVGKTPTKPLFGIGGNDKCNGSQTVSTGMVGNVKLFKMGYFFGDDLADNVAYDAEELTALCCSDMYGEKTNGNVDDWNYSKELQTLDVFDDTFYSDGIWGIGQPSESSPLTILYGNTPHGANISNYNPYDTLFTAPMWRNVTDCEPSQLRTNAGFVQTYLKGGASVLQNDDVAIINNVDGQFSYIVGLPREDDSLVQFVSLLNQPIGYISGTSSIDTEEGLNDNRIHIDNLPIQSYNAKIGAMDRCIYQTQSVVDTRQVGSNFINSSFTNPSKIWIPIKNAGSIYLNEFNVKITDLDNIVDEEVISAQATIEIKSPEEMVISK